MRSLKLILPVILMLIITACSSIRVSTDYDRRADFRQYRTFNFARGVDRINLSELNRNRLKDDIADQMEARGYRLDKSPDLLINVFIKGRTKTTATATNFGGPWGPWGGPWGYYHGWGWGGPSSTYIDVNKYVEGTMFVDIIDVSQKRMIWEGIAEGLINPRTQTTPRDLEKVVDKVFKDFPR
jgi:hypothetical protein